MRSIQHIALIMFAIGALSTNCGKKKEESKDKVTNVDSNNVATNFPKVQGIRMSTLGTNPSTTLAATDCNQGDQLGVFGLALGAACHTVPLASTLLLGSITGDHNSDGKLDCNDLTYAKEKSINAGLLQHLICEPVFLNYKNITRFAFNDNNSSVLSVSFDDIPQTTNTAVGLWSASSPSTENYPANITLFKGASFSEMTPNVVFDLTNPDNGEVWLNMTDSNTKVTYTWYIRYQNTADTSKCAETPNTTNCNWQEIKIYTGDTRVTQGPPAGIHLVILVDNRENPSFYALEGKYLYDAAGAAASFGTLTATIPDIINLRTLYFTVVQKSTQVWGRFFFRNEAGDLLTFNSGGFSIFAQMAGTAGICQNLSSSDWVACSAVNPTDYTSLWRGESVMETVSSSPMGQLQTDAVTKATEVGLWTQSGKAF